MKKIKVFILVLFILCTAGCYNYRELNQLAITSAIGIDKSDDGYELHIQVVNTQKQGSDGSVSGDKPKFIVYESKGRTLQEAFRNVILESPERLYVNHLAVLIISEKVAEEGIDDIIDIFARDSEFRKQFMVVISKNDDTNDIVSILTNLETLNSKNITDSITNDSRYLGSANIVTFEDLLDAYLDEKIDISIPSIKMEGNKNKGTESENIQESIPSAAIKLSGLSVFNNSKLIGYLDKNDSMNVSILKNDIDNSIYTYKCDDNNYISIEIIDSKTDIKIKDDQTIGISISEKANISEVNCHINLEKQSDLDKLTKQIENDMKNSLLKTIEKLVNEYQSDIIGFKNYIYKNKPSYYKELIKKYDDDILKNINFDIDVDLKMYAKGNLLKEI